MEHVRSGERLAKYTGGPDEVVTISNDRAFMFKLPFFQQEGGAFYPTLTVRESNFEAQLIDPDGKCQGYVHVAYDPGKREPICMSRVESTPGLIKNVLSQYWMDISAVSDLRVGCALPSLERLLFGDGLEPIEIAPSDSIN